MSPKLYESKLSEEELSELDELLAEIPQEYEAMDLAEADGFITAILLLPEQPATREWISYVVSTVGKGGTTADKSKDKKIRELLISRFNEVAERLKNSVLIDPVYFDLEDEKNYDALEPFALGFLEACQLWPGITDTESTKISSALHGIFRHLPQESLGDFAATKIELDKVDPLGNLLAALSDVSSCVAEIALINKGYPLPELVEKEDEKGSTVH